MVWFQKTSACVKWRKAKRRKNRRCAPGASTFRPSWSVPGTCGDESSRTAKRKAMTPAPQKKTTGFQTEKKSEQNQQEESKFVQHALQQASCTRSQLFRRFSSSAREGSARCSGLAPVCRRCMPHTAVGTSWPRLTGSMLQTVG